MITHLSKLENNKLKFYIKYYIYVIYVIHIIYLDVRFCEFLNVIKKINNLDLAHYNA